MEGTKPSSPLPIPPRATPMRRVESETRMPSVPSVKHTLSWIRHSRSFKIILIGAGRNPERCVVVMCKCWRYFWNLRRYSNGKTANTSISTTTPWFEDTPVRNAFECLEIVLVRETSHWPTFLPLIATVYVLLFKSNALSQEVLAENGFGHEIATQGHSRSLILQQVKKG